MKKLISLAVALATCLSAYPFCNGLTTVTTPNGTLTDGSGEDNYSHNALCEWLIAPLNASQATLMFTAFNLGTGDTLRIHNGTSAAAPLLATLTSGSSPGFLQAASGSFFIRFSTDTTDAGAGWSISYNSVSGGGSGNGVALTAFEYWFDNASLLRQQVGLSPQPVQHLSTTLSAASLDAGMHQLHSRFKDEHGNWSAVHSVLFVKPPLADPNAANTISGYEYWFDNNPALRYFTSLTSGQYFSLEASITQSALLPNGLHQLHLRFRDNLGQWSVEHSQFFVKAGPNTAGANQIAAYRYWFDANTAGAVSQSLATPVAVFELSSVLSASALGSGIHTLNVQFKDTQGKWGSVSSRFFFRMNAPPNNPQMVAAYRYWFDSDVANMSTHNLATPQSVYEFSPAVSTPTLSNGVHALRFQFRDTQGKWSTVFTHPFIKIGAASGSTTLVKAYRYWFDQNSAAMTSMTLPIPLSPFELSPSIDVGNLSAGSHTVHFQFLDNKGQWSAATNDAFNVGAEQPPVAQFTYTSNSPCSGGIVNFTNTSANADAYLWQFGNGQTSTQASPTHQYSAAGTYTVLLTATNTLSGLMDSYSASVTVVNGVPETCNGLDDDCNGNPEAAVNTWTGLEDDGLWTTPGNWSDGIIPLACQDVVIPAGHTVNVPDGVHAVGRTLDVSPNAQLLVPVSAILTVQQ